MKLYGSLSAVSFSPIVTIEPRRRKFHRTIELRMPLPASYSHQTEENLRLLCSIEEGQNRAEWKDMTDSIKPLAIDNQSGCLIFPTTISARYWLVHGNTTSQRASGGSQRSSASQLRAQAAELYRHLICVPFMAKFVIFAKRRDINEANIRVFCMTDDKEERTLEVQEHYTQVAKSRDVEVVDGQTMYLEFGGNLVPSSPGSAGRRFLGSSSSAVLINEQLAFNFRAFQENRLAFAVRLRELGQDASGRIAFVEDSMRYLSSLNAQQRQFLYQKCRRAICTLGLSLPPMCVNYDNILGTPKRNSYYASARIGDLTLADIAAELDEPPRHHHERAPDEDSLHSGEAVASSSDWIELAPKLGIPRDEVDYIMEYCRSTGIGQARGTRVSPALHLLMHWYKLASPEERDQDLARALVAIGRPDIAQRLNFPIEPKKMSRSTMELLREIELIPVRSTENLFLGPELYDRPRGGSELGLAGSMGESRGTSRLRSSSRSAIGSGGGGPDGATAARVDSGASGQPRRSSSGRLLSQQSRTEINVPNSDLMETRVSTKEWTQAGNDGTLSHMVEQTTIVEAKPRDGSSKKQRRRKSGANMDGLAQGGVAGELADEKAALTTTTTTTTTKTTNDDEDCAVEAVEAQPLSSVARLPATVGQEPRGEQQQLEAASDNNDLGAIGLAPKIQTTEHAQASSSSAASCTGEANVLERGSPPPQQQQEKSHSGAAVEAKPSNSGTSSPFDPERAQSAAQELLAAQLALKALESSLSGEHQRQRTITADAVSDCSLDSSGSGTSGPNIILDGGEEKARQGNNPDPDRVLVGTSSSDITSRTEEEEEEPERWAGGCNLGCAGAPDAAPTPQPDGPESGDYSLSTTTDDTTVIQAAPLSTMELNVNVSAPAPELGSASAQELEPELELDSFSSAGQEGFMEELDGSEGAKSGRADLDSGERTAGWGWRERREPTKFKDAHGEGEEPTGQAGTEAPYGSGVPLVGQEEEPAAALSQPTTATTARATTRCEAYNSDNTDEIALGSGTSSSKTTNTTTDDLGRSSGQTVGETEAVEPKGELAGEGRNAIKLQKSIEAKRTNGAGSAGSSVSAGPPEPKLSRVMVNVRGFEEVSRQTVSPDGSTNLEADRRELSSSLAGTTGSRAITTELVLPSDKSRKRSGEAAVVDGECALAASDSSSSSGGNSTAERGPAASPAAISGKQGPTPTRPTELGSGSEPSESHRKRTRVLALGGPASTQPTCGDNNNNNRRQRPKSEVIVKRESSQIGQSEYFAATDSELHLESEKISSSSSSSSSTSQGQKIRRSSAAAGISQDQRQNNNSSNNNNNCSSSSQSRHSSSYVTAPLGQLPTSSSTSYADFTTVSTSLSHYETARSDLTLAGNNNEDPIGSASSTSSLAHENSSTTGEMVSFSIEDRVRSLSQAANSSDADTPTMTPNTEELEDMDATVEGEDNVVVSGRVSEPAAGVKLQSSNPGPSQMVLVHQQPQTTTTTRQDSEIVIDESIDEEQLKRILACKRLSEGCNRFVSNFVTRKNSLHMIEELPPLTEGEAMKHMSYHLSQTMDQSTASSSSSGSLRVGVRPQNLLRDLAMKRGSQDENTSCSSSTSLERSPTRRRSSTVSQCSSVLSETTRNQLNFDLSPDLPPDSSLLEANAISPTEFERPASPEPNSLSGEAFEFRPTSRMSHEELVLASPDSTLGDSNDNEAMEEQLNRLTQSCCQHQDMELSNESESNQFSMGAINRQAARQEEVISEHLEQIISDVSTVAVSTGAVSASKNTDNKTSSKRPASDDSANSCQVSSFGQKSARSSTSGQDGAERRSSLVRATTPCSQEAQSNSPEGVIRPGSVASTSSSRHRSMTAKSSMARSRTLNTPSPTANSTCSSSSSSHSSVNSRVSKISNTNRKNNDDYRLLHVIEMERKDSRLRQKRQATISPVSSAWRGGTEGSSVKRLAASGHRHSSQDTGPLCYCHNL